jgi:hypothetical protein
VIDVDDKLIIPREKLLRILRLLVDHVAPEPGTELTVDQDFFWTVPPARLYNPYEEPDELTLGQLTDSWAKPGEAPLRRPSSTRLRAGVARRHPAHPRTQPRGITLTRAVGSRRPTGHVDTAVVIALCTCSHRGRHREGGHVDRRTRRSWQGDRGSRPRLNDLGLAACFLAAFT